MLSERLACPKQMAGGCVRILLPRIFFFFFFNLLFFLICSGFCHTLKWNSHGFTRVPHPDPPSHLPLHPLPLGLKSDFLRIKSRGWEVRGVWSRETVTRTGLGVALCGLPTAVKLLFPFGSHGEACKDSTRSHKCWSDSEFKGEWSQTQPQRDRSPDHLRATTAKGHFLGDGRPGT